LTVKVARLLATLPVELLTITANMLPLSDIVVAGDVYAAPVAPLITVPFLVH
jgi:hypothetical protein